MKKKNKKIYILVFIIFIALMMIAAKCYKDYMHKKKKEKASRACTIDFCAAYLSMDGRNIDDFYNENFNNLKENRKELKLKVAYANMVCRKEGIEEVYTEEDLLKKFYDLLEGDESGVEYIEEFSDVYDKHYSKYVGITEFRGKVAGYLDRKGVDDNTFTLEEMQEAIDEAVKYYEEKK